MFIIVSRFSNPQSNVTRGRNVMEETEQWRRFIAAYMRHITRMATQHPVTETILIVKIIVGTKCHDYDGLLRRELSSLLQRMAVLEPDDWSQTYSFIRFDRSKQEVINEAMEWLNSHPILSQKLPRSATSVRALVVQVTTPTIFFKAP